MVHRPQPGFWTRSEFDDSVQQCLPPSTARCVGWLSSEDAVQCGTGYQSPSSGCDQCSDGYFPQLSTCLPCPAQRSTIVFTVLVFAGVCLGVFCFILALILVTTSRNDVPVITAVYRSRDMILWTLMTWQTIVQVGKRAVFVPSELRQFYTWLSVVELDTSPVVHPACYSRYPFTLQSVELGASIVVTVFVTVTSLRCPKGLHVIVRTLRRLSVSFLALFYALATNTALNMVHCTESDSLQGKPALASNPDLQCWSGDHLYVGVLSLFVLMCHTVGFPLVSWLVLSRQARRDDGHTASHTIWSIFVAGDYQRQYFWFPHVQMIVLLSLSVLLVYFPVNPSPELAVSEVSVFAATFGIIAIYCWLLLWKQPFVVKRRWKLPVKVLALSVTLFGSACNFSVCTGAKVSQRPLVSAHSFVVHRHDSVSLVGMCTGCWLCVFRTFGIVNAGEAKHLETGQVKRCTVYEGGRNVIIAHDYQPTSVCTFRPAFLHAIYSNRLCEPFAFNVCKLLGYCSRARVFTVS
jgi:hypothetical protein